MNIISNFVPVFYLRGFNEPYNEGNIQVARMMIKSLSFYGKNCMIFNYRYPINNAEVNTHPLQFRYQRVEVGIPFVDRERVLRPKMAGAIYAFVMESLLTWKFILAERRNADCPCVVNVINSTKYPLFFARRFAKNPLILHVYKRGEDRTWMKMVIDSAEKIITSSRIVARYLEDAYNISKSKIEELCPPVDTHMYKPAKMEPTGTRKKAAREAPTILYVGGLTPPDRFPIGIVLGILKSLRKDFPNVRLLVFAHSSRENSKRASEIQRQAKKLSLLSHVQIEARNLTDVEKSTIYNESEVFIFPSLQSYSATEPPIAILEAMASGLPVVSHDIPSVRELITNDVNGLIRPIGNGGSIGLAERISLLLKDEEKRAKISLNARQTILERSSLGKIGRRLLEIHNDLLPNT